MIWADSGAMNIAKLDDQEGSRSHGDLPNGSWRRERVRLLVVIIALCALLPAVGFSVERVLNKGRVLAGVWIDTEAVSGLRESDLRAALERLEKRYRQRTIRVRVGSSIFRVEAGRLGLHIDVPATVSAALSMGRARSLADRMAFFVSSWGKSHHLEPTLRLEPAAVAVLADEWEKTAITERPVLGGIGFENGSPTVRQPRAGWIIDRSSVLAALTEGARTARGNVVGLSLTRVMPEFAPDELESARAKAETWLVGGIKLTHEDPPLKLVLTREQLGRTLVSRVDSSVRPHRVTLEIDSNAIKQYVSGPEFSVEARDASFRVDSKQKVTVVPSRAALSVSPEEIAQRIQELLDKGEREGALPVRSGDQPKLTTEIAQALGIEKHLISFMTMHPCCQPRVQNIHRIADLIDGVVVLPGQTFSVNEHVGQRTSANGFVPAPSIEDGEMVDTVGGGISQFATTLFNAVLRAGFDIVSRKPHTYWFPRYPMGFEATLSWPKPDLAFRNDTDAGLLLKTDYSAKHIRVSLYGNTRGRRVETEVSDRTDIIQPDVELLPNPSLEVDEEKLIDGGCVGWTVHTIRRVTTDGVTKEEKRKVVYAPQVRRVEVHPCRVPEGEEGYTGEPCPVPEEAPSVEGGETGEGVRNDDAVPTPATSSGS